MQPGEPALTQVHDAVRILRARGAIDAGTSLGVALLLRARVPGRSISPRLFVAVGTSGGLDHLLDEVTADTVLAIDPDPAAAVFGHADVGIVADVQEGLSLVVDELADVNDRGAGIRRPLAALAFVSPAD